MRVTSTIFFILNNFLVVIFFKMLLAQTAYADKKEEFREYLNQAKDLKNTVSKSTTAFSPEKTFDNYSPNPDTSKYYSEDNAGASQTMKSDSISSLTTNEKGKVIAESSKIRPQFKINHESEEIKKSREIQILASEKIKGTLEEFISGKEDQVNTKETKYVVKTCNEEIRVLKRVCIKSPIIKVISQPYQEMQQYSGSVSCVNSNSGNITVPVSGVITSFSSHFHSYNYWRCNVGYPSYLQGAHVSTYSCPCGCWLGELYFSNGGLNINVSANTPIPFSFQGYARGAWHTSGYSLSIKANLTKKATETTWEEVCHDI